MKKLVGVVVILVLAAAGFAGVAYWSGMQAERWYQDALTEGSKNPNIKFTTVRYERGLLSSHSVTRVQFTLPEGSESKETDPSFSIRQDIYHGPLPLAGRNVPGVPMNWGGAVVRATLDPDSSAWTRELAKLYGGQEPIVAISQVGFDGASDTLVTMPPLTLSNVEEMQSLNFSGLQGQFQVAPRGTAVRGKMTVASLDVIEKPTASEGQPASGAGQVKFSNLSLDVNQRKGAFDLMFGESSFRIGELRAQDQATGAPVVITNLTITGALSPQGTQQVAGEVVIKADQISANQRSGSGSLRLALRNLDGAAVLQLQQWQQKLAGKPDDPQAMDELPKLMKALLLGKPEFALDTQAKLSEGTWQGKLVLNFQDFDLMNSMQNPMGLLAALEKGSADVTVSKALLETELNKMSEGQAAQQLEGVMAAGFLRLEGDQYKSTARFEGGKLLVNGKEIPLPAASEDSNSEEVPVEPDGNTEAPAPQ
ncbi:YdgA family protein [Candidatus Contendibacter odensensis]|uniref:DUF945 domain-containing protein n=1 Tax=Candidatus Contendobacter odensis Run_B_J11 TaxID=1400861 RepID=A0A7U7G8Z7_9GAMM|nr:YdgA family protein [Candidatus Contendobacter odensis]CDH44101.1 exported hypothetical protein [Candidatus Contendobacter odensis Run_B_J11]